MEKLREQLSGAVTVEHRKGQPFYFRKLEDEQPPPLIVEQPPPLVEQPPPLVEQPPPQVEQPPPLMEQPPPPRLVIRRPAEPPPPSPTGPRGPGPS